MKRQIVMILWLMFVMAASAQDAVGTWSLKPMVGGTMANLAGKGSGNNKSKIGIVAGGEVAYQTTRHLALSLGVLYAQQGAKDFSLVHTTNETINDYQFKTEYVNVPLLANYYLMKGLALKTGMQIGLLVKARETMDYYNLESDYIKFHKKIDDDVKSGCYTFDLSIPIGLSYEYENFVLDVRYQAGLTRVLKDNKTWWRLDESKWHNSVFQLTLGYKFAL
jgi:hypothetical protein